MNDKVSVIVPVYNVEKYLFKCIDSILRQTYTNLEIILVNDGSTDSSGDICNAYALKDSRITVIHKENGGLSDARNVGLAKASGLYISFIDSDDYIHGQFYQCLMELLIKHQADIVQCAFLKVDEEDIHYHDQQYSDDETITILSSFDALGYLFSTVNTVVVWNKLYKKNLFNQIKFPKGRIYEDEFTTPKVLFNAKKIIVTSRPMYYYLHRSDSITTKEFTRKRLDSIAAFCEQVIFFNSVGLLDLENKAIIRLEKQIRLLITKTLKSSLDNKNEIFMELIYHYRQNYYIFNNMKNISLKKKISIFFFRYDISLYLYFKFLRINR